MDLWAKYLPQGQCRNSREPNRSPQRNSTKRPPSPAKAAMPSATRPARPAENLRGGSVITITFGGSSAASAKTGWAKLWYLWSFSKCTQLCFWLKFVKKMEQCSLNFESMENRNHWAKKSGQHVDRVSPRLSRAGRSRLKAAPLG